MLKVKEGNFNTLGLLFERHNRSLFGFFYRITRDKNLSEDLVQTVFERMLKYRKTYSGSGAFTTWMFTIARNVHIDHYRQNKKHSEISEFDEAFIGEVPAEYGEESILQKQKKILEKALEMLDSDKKEVVILSRYEGLKYSEIAQIQGITENAVKVRFFRAMKDLKSTVNQLKEG